MTASTAPWPRARLVVRVKRTLMIWAIATVPTARIANVEKAQTCGIRYFHIASPTAAVMAAKMSKVQVVAPWLKPAHAEG
ncbi:MAG: hypothetical protein E6H66_15220 [Betaproteobacteria bacterium]|nr:MAG: hypothetical protein E6H66_15220 [Betaproteobacteria bacterium]